MNIWNIYIAIYVYIPLCWAATGSGGGRDLRTVNPKDTDDPSLSQSSGSIGGSQPRDQNSGTSPKVATKGGDSTPKSPTQSQSVKTHPSTSPTQSQPAGQKGQTKQSPDEDDDSDEEEEGIITDLFQSLPLHGSTPVKMRLEDAPKPLVIPRDKNESRVTRLTDEDYNESLFFINTRVLFFSHNLQIITDSGGVRKINDETQYNKIAGYDGYIYEMNNQTKCVGIDYLNKLVWAIPTDSTIYPDMVEFNVNEPPTIVISFPDDQMIYRYIDSAWRLQADATKQSERIDPSTIMIITSDDVFGSASSENDLNKYDVVTYPELKLYCYILKPNSNCIGLNYQNSNVWSHERAEYGYEFPTKVFFHTDSLIIVIQFEKFYMVYKYDTIWKFDRKIYTTYFSDDDIEVITYKEAGSSTVLTNDTTKYELIKHYYLRNYKFHSGTRCPAIKYKKKQVWVRHHLYESYYPKSIQFNLETLTFFIDFDEDWYYVYKYDDDLRQWYLSYYDETKKPAHLPDIIHDGRSRPTSEAADTGIIKQRRMVQTSAIEYEEDELPDFADEPDFSSNFFIIQKFDARGKLNSLFANRKKIWEKDEFTRGINSILFESNLLLASINLSKTEFLIYGFNGSDWIRKKPAPSGLIDLDINSKKTTDVYKYEKQGNMEIYTPISDYYFTKIVKGGLNQRGTHNSYLWQSKSPFESCEKVEVVSGSSNHLEVRLHLVDGSQLSYLSSGLTSPFYKNKWSQSTSTIPKDFNVFTVKDGTPPAMTQNDLSKFYMYKHTKTPNSASSEIEIYKFGFHFFDTTKCILFKRKDETIWQYNDQGHYPRAITFDLDANKGYIEFKDPSLNREFTSNLLRQELESEIQY